MKRVVVTGMGAVTPLGNNVDEFWENIKAGKNGIGPITQFDTEDFKVKIAAEVKNLDMSLYMDKKEERRSDRFCQLGMAAAIQAYEDSGLNEDTIDPYELAVIVGSGIGGMTTFQNECQKLFEKGPGRVSPFMVPMIIGNILGGTIAIKYNAKGLCHCIVTACATGTDSIGEAMRLIQTGAATAAFAGAAEAPINKMSVAGFTNMTALSTRNEIDGTSIPFDKNRDGFVVGEGGAILILEELEHAKARNAKIYAEVVGYGSTCDAYHITMPDPDSTGAAKAMELAIKQAGIAPSEISYINAHGTSTPYNDACETKAIKAVFGENAKQVPISSTKSMTGHMLGAAGSAESIICIKALQDGFVPPTINYTTPDEELDLDYVPNVGRAKELTYALTNSLGFGGHNGTLVFKKYAE
ncbi:MAG: beta-ketoacyl-[acyl-carrier-protein] synthase II [Clostridiales bacterium 43-6]|nr:MAG: beta-ketoacyl-[acyl-carrier-protein] synthase II [Clostridiales bacterium 43-6]